MEDPRLQQKLEKLEKQIYARDYPSETSPRSNFSKTDVSTEKDWQHEHPLSEIQIFPEPKRWSLLKKIFVISIIFFIASAGIALYAFFGGINIVSADKVDITFVGPVSIAAGDELDFDAVVANKNDSVLENVVLNVDFAPGTKQANDKTKDLLHQEFSLGNIAAGATDRQTIKAILFGAEHDIKDLQFTLTYNIKGSNTPFRKQKALDIELSSAPLAVTVNYPEAVPSNQELDYTVTLISNSKTVLSNLILQGSYPFGFEFLNANPSPSFDTNVWVIPALQPGEKRTFTVHGRIEGQDGDERVFRFDVGAASASSSEKIATNYLTSAASISVQKPPIGIAMLVNGSSTVTSLVNPGQQNSGSFEIVNNLSTPVKDVNIQIIFSGNALNAQSPNGNQARYIPEVKTLVWDKNQIPGLAEIDPGQRVAVNFNFQALSADQLNGNRNGSIVATAQITANSGATNSLLKASLDRTMKIQPSIGLLPRLVYSVGPFGNTGPIPPKSGQKTTYTVIWTLTSSLDDMAGINVHATLPTYVHWQNVVRPSGEQISWNPDKNEIVWHVDDIPGGQVGSPAREIDFQVQVEPTPDQVGTTPVVLDNIHLEATDGFTGNPVTATVQPLTTNISTDPKFIGQSGVVKQ